MVIDNLTQAYIRIAELINKTKAALCLAGSLQYQGVNDPIAKHLGIQLKEAQLPPDCDGLYSKDNNIPIIVLNKNNYDLDRRNFTYFHEICHHLIKEDGELYSFIEQYSLGSDLPEEHFANFGAAEFLMPQQQVQSVLKDNKFDVKLLPLLHQKFYASKPAIAAQLAYCASHKCFVIYAERISMYSAKITYSWSSKNNRYSIPRNSKINDKNHLVIKAFETRDLTQGEVNIPRRDGRKWICKDCEAIFYQNKVFAIYNLEPPQNFNKDQNTLF